MSGDHVALAINRDRGVKTKNLDYLHNLLYFFFCNADAGLPGPV
jgi:hypothetical protein